MPFPRWSTTGLLLALVAQFVLSWLQARKTGKDFREAVLPSALIAVAVSIIFARELFGDLPVWIDALIVTACSLLILIALVLLAVKLKRHLKERWRLEDK